MKENPILCSTPMVQAILEGRKTMTRRVVSEKLLDKYYNYDDWCSTVGLPNCPVERQYKNEKEYLDGRCKYSIGDILWVRETWNEYLCDSESVGRHFVYKADNPYFITKLVYKHWKPSRYMPREAVRIFLEVANIRVEQLQDITQEDIWKEGIISDIDDFGYEHFYNLTKPTFSERGENHFCTHTKKDNYISIGYKTPQEAFINLWDKINKKRGYSWESNPWVWVIEFRRIEK